MFLTDRVLKVWFPGSISNYYAVHFNSEKGDTILSGKHTCTALHGRFELFQFKNIIKVLRNCICCLFRFVTYKCDFDTSLWSLVSQGAFCPYFTMRSLLVDVDNKRSFTNSESNSYKTTHHSLRKRRIKWIQNGMIISNERLKPNQYISSKRNSLFNDQFLYTKNIVQLLVLCLCLIILRSLYSLFCINNSSRPWCLLSLFPSKS